MYELPTYRLPVDAALRPDPVDTGWVRRISQEPRTLAKILADASRQMDLEDEQLERERDPVAWLRAHRPRNRLIDRLLYGRQR